MLFSEPKISQCLTRCCRQSTARVSVLFSEPKISQSSVRGEVEPGVGRFSALQRAENFSIFGAAAMPSKSACFSALQRAENFSIDHRRRLPAHSSGFQCSSASRKFLNRRRRAQPAVPARVSVLFSEPKISQSMVGAPMPESPITCFSALQRAENFSMELPPPHPPTRRRFSALQRAENFSIGGDAAAGDAH